MSGPFPVLVHSLCRKLSHQALGCTVPDIPQQPHAMEGGLWVSNEREVFFLIGPPNEALIEGLEVPETPGSPSLCSTNLLQPTDMPKSQWKSEASMTTQSGRTGKMTFEKTNDLLRLCFVSQVFPWMDHH